MFFRGNKMYAMVSGCCPKCHTESMYVEKNPFKLSFLYKMKPHCSRCNTVYQVEPAFFYGAMYISYALGVFFAIITFLITYYYISTKLHFNILTILGVLTILSPVMIRLSRNIWINMFINFDKQYLK
jgi:uncharacterized protein (DUF983 family)